MFQQHLREVLSQVEPKKTLIYQPNLAEKVDLLTLVKKKRGSFCYDYEVMSHSLGDLVPAFADFSDFSERTVIKDYKYSGQRSVSAGAQGGVEVASAGVSAEAQSEQEVSSVTINIKTADLRKMKEKYHDQKINTFFMPELKKGEMLGFVSEIVFNTEDVALCGRTGVDGSVEARWSVFSILLGGKMKDNNSFVVPAGHTYAYKLNELKFLKEETEGIVRVGSFSPDEEEPFTRHALSAEPVLHPQSFEPDDYTEKTFETLQQVQEELRRNEDRLQNLANLPQETRSTLFQSLSVLSEDRQDLTLLKQKLDQWRAFEPEEQLLQQPQSSSISSVLHVLRDFMYFPGSIIAYDIHMEAVYLLTSAMDKLPDRVPSLIAKCGPDTLTGLNQLVSSLKEHGQAHLSESLPAPLQEGGELHGLAVFLCSSDESLRELSELAIVTGDQPGVLLLALCAAVQGLSMLLQ